MLPSPRHTLAALVVFATWAVATSAAADQVFVDFEEAEWEMGCMTDGVCPFGYVEGTPTTPLLGDTNCVYGRCLLASFLDTGTLQSFIPRSAGWVPDPWSFHFEASVKLGVELETVRFNLPVLHAEAPDAGGMVVVRLRKDSDTASITAGIVAWIGTTPTTLCETAASIAASEWNTLVATLTLPGGVDAGNCAVSLGGTTDTTPITSSPFGVHGLFGMRVLSQLEVSSPSVFPVRVGIDDVCITEVSGAASYCEEQRMDRDPAWMDAGVPDASTVDAGPDADPDLDSGSTGPPSGAQSFRGVGGCACEASGEPRGPVSAMLFAALLALVRRRRRR